MSNAGVFPVEQTESFVYRISKKRWKVTVGNAVVEIKSKKSADNFARLLASYPALSAVRPGSVLSDAEKEAALDAMNEANVGSTRVVINPDQTVSVRGEGEGFFAMMAESNCRYVNLLEDWEVLGVFRCVALNPFPLGGEFKTIDAVVENGDLKKQASEMREKHKEQATVGFFRRLLVEKAGGGCNAPHDSYIRWWVEHRHSEAYAKIQEERD